MKTIALLIALLCAAGHAAAAEPGPALPLRPRDVVAWLGGATVALRADAGRFEALLAVARPDAQIRFRSLAWEGDTVFDQPRPVNFPAPTEEIAKSGATVVFLEFGQAEALQGAGEADFAAACRTLSDRIAAVVPRVVWILPAPFETQASPRPNPAARNPLLARYVERVREIAARPGFAVLDLFTPLRDQPAGLTTDGWHPSPRGDAASAALLVAALTSAAPAPAAPINAAGRFTSEALEGVRRQAVEKNALWFHYARPMNWAFLGGDRTEQPSSHDHLHPERRWFPEEMQRFPPLVADAERRLDDLARAAASVR